MDEFLFLEEKNENKGNYSEENISKKVIIKKEIFYFKDENTVFEKDTNEIFVFQRMEEENKFEILVSEDGMKASKKIFKKEIEVKFGGRYFSKKFR